MQVIYFGVVNRQAGYVQQGIGSITFSVISLMFAEYILLQL